jgi:hypothetical protein
MLGERREINRRMILRVGVVLLTTPILFTIPLIKSHTNPVRTGNTPAFSKQERKQEEQNSVLYSACILSIHLHVQEFLLVKWCSY